ncbi:BTB/POZ and MATH domain-containing protein 2-like [Oryza brachyantha]|uniref:BTB domain-containing protein n=1 Tax=Oryza brachyantha TaxID=4533 RepID=J3N2T1_ORYBR|nr:BTB/POZ and MATH domain-containing protein 2-like [Oryza brachyantha]
MSFRGAGVPSARSSSAIVVGTEHGYHLLKIDGYSRTKELLPFGKCTRSCSFRVGNHSWHIRYYPNGNSNVVRHYTGGDGGGARCDADCVSLSLVLEPKDYGYIFLREMGEVRFSLLDRAGKPVPGCTRAAIDELPRLSGEGVRDLWPSRVFLSFPNFIEREELEASEHLVDDRFTVRCDITLMTEPSAAADPPAPVADVAVPPPELQRDMEALLLGEEGADVTFEVGGESFAAHRCVLAARSSVFRAELFGAMKESTGKVRIDGVEPKAFRALLHYIYTEAVAPELDDDADDETEPEDTPAATTSLAQHLLVAADRYNLERLKLICEDKLCKRIDVSSAATTLALAEQHSCPSLKKACMDFLNAPGNLRAVEATDGFEHLASSCPAVLRELIAKLVVAL